MGADGAEPADARPPPFRVSALIEMRLHRKDGAQPQVNVGRVKDIVDPLRVTAVTAAGEPALREGGADRTLPGFRRPSDRAGTSFAGADGRVIDARNRAVIADDPVACVAVAVVDNRVQYTEQQPVPRFQVGPFLVPAPKHFHGRAALHELHIHLTPPCLVHGRHPGA